MNELSRRRLVATLAGSGVFLGTAARALAFQETQPTQRLLALKENACGASASHKDLVAEVNKVLGEGYTEAQKQEVIASLTCPVCGCPLAGLF
jgi:hypothetical protein